MPKLSWLTKHVPKVSSRLETNKNRNEIFIHSIAAKLSNSTSKFDHTNRTHGEFSKPQGSQGIEEWHQLVPNSLNVKKINGLSMAPPGANFFQEFTILVKYQKISKTLR